MEYNYKEVYYDQYCEFCKHRNASEDECPCCACLNEPVNTNSHKPFYWEENK